MEENRKTFKQKKTEEKKYKMRSETEKKITQILKLSKITIRN